MEYTIKKNLYICTFWSVFFCFISFSLPETSSTKVGKSLSFLHISHYLLHLAFYIVLSFLTSQSLVQKLSLKCKHWGSHFQMLSNVYYLFETDLAVCHKTTSQDYITCVSLNWRVVFF